MLELNTELSGLSIFSWFHIPDPNNLAKVDSLLKSFPDDAPIGDILKFVEFENESRD